jgi:hypothetical protein
MKKFAFTFVFALGSLYAQEYDDFRAYLEMKVEEERLWPINPNTIYSEEDLYNLAYHIGRGDAFWECLETYDK